MAIVSRLRRLSKNQLQALKILAQSKRGVVSSYLVGQKLGLQGKSLGGLFSSLSRIRIKGEPLILPAGRSEKGVGLRWLLNPELVNKKEVLKEVESLLFYY